MGEYPSPEAERRKYAVEHGINFDGAISKNPGGIATYGCVLQSAGRTLEHKGLVGWGDSVTVNVAEFHALLEALDMASRLEARLPGHDHAFVIRGDSQFVVKTVNGEQNCKADHLVPLRDEARELLDKLDAKLEWVPRERNAHADRLAKEAMIEAFEGLSVEARRRFIWSMPSEFEGTCSGCDFPIAEGSPVTKTGEGWVHVRCAYIDRAPAMA